MRLTDRERRTLAGIERDLSRSDPDLAATLRDGPTPAGWVRIGWTRAAGDVVAVLAGVTALVCVVLVLIGPAVVAGLLAVVAARPRWTGRRRSPVTADPTLW